MYRCIEPSRSCRSTFHHALSSIWRPLSAAAAAAETAARPFPVSLVDCRLLPKARRTFAADGGPNNLDGVGQAAREGGRPVQRWRPVRRQQRPPYRRVHEHKVGIVAGVHIRLQEQN